MKYFIQVIILSPLFLVQDAHAYLDPGTASLIIQGLIAGVASAISLCALYWAKVKNFFSKKPERNEGEDPQEETD